MTKLTVAFRSFAIAPRNGEVPTERVTTLSCKILMSRRNYVCFC